MRPFLSLLAFGALIAIAPAVHAASVTYTESAIGSGAFDGSSFTNALITFSATGSTSNITNQSGIFDSILPTTITVAGFGIDSFLDSIQFVDNQNLTLAGLGDVTSNSGILFTSNAAFGTYNLATAIGPLSGSNMYSSGHAFATKSGSTFTLSSVTGNSTFQATVPVSTSTTPEPSSLVLLATGSLGLAGAVRRKLSR